VVVGVGDFEADCDVEAVGVIEFVGDVDVDAVVVLVIVGVAVRAAVSDVVGVALIEFD